MADSLVRTATPTSASWAAGAGWSRRGSCDWLALPSRSALGRRRLRHRRAHLGDPGPRVARLGARRSTPRGQVARGRRRVDDPRAAFSGGHRRGPPRRVATSSVSGLVLNFVPSTPTPRVAAMAAAAPGGVVAAYVWDYAEGMQLLRMFWDVACALDPAAADLNEGHRFSLCEPRGARRAVERAGLDRRCSTTAIEVADRVRGLRRPLAAVPRRPGPGAGVRRDAGERRRARERPALTA